MNDNVKTNNLMFIFQRKGQWNKLVCLNCNFSLSKMDVCQNDHKLQCYAMLAVFFLFPWIIYDFKIFVFFLSVYNIYFFEFGSRSELEPLTMLMIEWVNIGIGSCSKSTWLTFLPTRPQPSTLLGMLPQNFNVVTRLVRI